MAMRSRRRVLLIAVAVAMAIAGAATGALSTSGTHVVADNGVINAH